MHECKLCGRYINVGTLCSECAPLMVSISVRNAQLDVEFSTYATSHRLKFANYFERNAAKQLWLSRKALAGAYRRD